MEGRQIAYLLLGIVGLVLVALLGMTVGYVEALTLAAGLALLAVPAWFPPALTRIVGTLYGGGVVVAVANAPMGFAVALPLGVGAAALSYLLLPLRVQRRVTFMIPSLVLLIYVTCVLMYMAPGSPFASEKKTTQQALEAQQRKFNVEPNAVAFFTGYMQRLVVDGTMGLAIKVQGRTVEDLLFTALPVSISLGLLALVIAAGLGLALGIRAGLRPNSLADYSSMGLALVGISLPNFVIGAAFLILFSLELGWLPVAGWGGYRHLLLPAITLALPYAAYIARLARNGTIEVMQQDFVRTARAKGLSEREVVLKHALKGAILPVVSFLGPAAAGIFTGSFVIETLFGVPGMGRWFVNGALGRDYSVVLGAAIIYFSLITIFNLLVDMAYAWLDPRVREDL